MYWSINWLIETFIIRLKAVWSNAGIELLLAHKPNIHILERSKTQSQQWILLLLTCSPDLGQLLAWIWQILHPSDRTTIQTFRLHHTYQTHFYLYSSRMWIRLQRRDQGCIPNSILLIWETSSTNTVFVPSTLIEPFSDCLLSQMSKLVTESHVAEGIEQVIGQSFNRLEYPQLSHTDRSAKRSTSR